MRFLATLCLAAAFCFSAAVSAHTHLLRSDPADGAEVKTAPTEAVLVFAEPVTVASAKLESSDGFHAKITPPGATSAEVHLTLPTLAAGRYQLSWRATSADGHVMAGGISFTVSGALQH